MTGSEGFRGGEYCGYVVESAALPTGYGGWECCRPTWRGTDSCVWHADDNDKPLGELRAAREEFEDGLDDDIGADHGERLDGAILPGIDLDALGLDGYTLIDADATGATLSGEALAGACLAHATLRGVDFRGAVLREANLFDADISGGDLRETDLRASDLRDATLADAKLRHADLAEADLRFATLERAGLVRANLCGADLARAELSDATVVSADLRGANARGATLRGAIMRRVDCGEDERGEPASLRGADFTATDCYNAEFSNADLRSATLEEATLRNASLHGADLENATLEDASIENADLASVGLERAILTRTNCFDADLTNATFYGAVFADTKINGETTFDVPALANFESRTAADADHERHDELIWMHRTVERLSRENAQIEQARAAFIARKDLRRRQYRAKVVRDLPELGRIRWKWPPDVWKRERGGRNRQGGISTWASTTLKLLSAEISGGVMRYGEGSRRVLFVSGFVLGICTLVYSGLYDLSVGKAFHASLISFLTPVGGTQGLGSELGSLAGWLRAGEALTGVLLTAVLVFVFGRRSTG